MTLLKTYDENGTQLGDAITDHADIAARLDSEGVLLERWNASAELSADADQDAVLAAYKEQVDALNAKYGFKSIDVVALTPDNPKVPDMRKMFLDEHTHGDFEVRFFVDGTGLFYLHCKDRVHCVLCEAGDLISVPAGVTHWFDMGKKPSFKCIRFFTTENGWVAEPTGTDVPTRFPDYDDFVSAA